MRPQQQQAPALEAPGQQLQSRRRTLAMTACRPAGRHAAFVMSLHLHAAIARNLTTSASLQEYGRPCFCQLIRHVSVLYPAWCAEIACWQPQDEESIRAFP